MLDANNFDQILKVESKYCHLESFSFDPAEDVLVLHMFGSATYNGSKDGTERTIHCFEKVKERMKDSNANGPCPAPKSVKSGIEMHLALLYSDGRDMEKAIASHRWLLAHCNRHEVVKKYLTHLSSNFNRFENFEYVIELLEGFMDMMETVQVIHDKNAWLNVECNEGMNEVQHEVRGAHDCSPAEVVFLFLVWVLETVVRQETNSQERCSLFLLLGYFKPARHKSSVRIK